MKPLPTHLLLLALAALPLTAAAQAQTPAADTAATYKPQLGLTASPVLDGFFKNNRSLPLGLLYKRQLTPNRALRLRLVGQFNYADSTNTIEDVIGITDGYLEGPNYRRWQLQVFAGYVWQRSLGRRTALDYGIEAGVGYHRQIFAAVRRRPYSLGGFAVDDLKRITQDFQVQIRPFAGFSYRPTFRLRLFAETGLPLSYSYQRMQYQWCTSFTKPDEADRLLDQRARANRVALAWQPVQLVGATYLF